MATTIGTESDLKALIKNLITLERDAIAAYDVVIDRLSDGGRAGKVRDFRSDHLSHLKELTALAEIHSAYAPDDGSAKSMLTTGKVKMADMVGGDGALLKAMSTNETDTVTAYGRAAEHEEADEDARAFFRRAHSDEERHKAWMEDEAQAA